MGFGNMENFVHPSGIEFITIKRLAFMMGTIFEKLQKAFPDADLSNFDEGPLHKVKLTKPFYISTTPVTRRQWAAAMKKSRPEQDETDEFLDTPITGKNIADIERFMVRLQEMLPQKKILGPKRPGYNYQRYRLPTEAEWEYTARAQTYILKAHNTLDGTLFPTGDDPVEAGKVIWSLENSGGVPHPVKQFPPNAWGLYDVCGNVGEWVSDTYSTPYSFMSGRAPILNPKGPRVRYVEENDDRACVIRGGSYADPLIDCRLGSRKKAHNDTRSSMIGFRVLRMA